MMYQQERIGILLVNAGEPDEPTPRAIRKYYKRFLNDPYVRPKGGIIWTLRLLFSILPSKSKHLAPLYRDIWGSEEQSAYIVTHRKLARALTEQYRSEGRDVVVHYAMNYSEPSYERAMTLFDQMNVDRVVVLPLYPQNAYSQAGSVAKAFAKAARARSWKTPYTIAGDYHDDSFYIKAIAASIRNAGFNPDSDDRLLFSYRSIPHKDILEGDTYELQTGASSLQIATELDIPRRQWTIGYQSRFENVREWVDPLTPDVLKRWAHSCTGRVFVVCPNYAVDCLDTLVEVDGQLRNGYLDELSKTDAHVVSDSLFVYVPCLDRSRAHVKVLAHVLEPYLS